MASFDEHIDKSISNLAFLQKVNSTFPEHIDWQITSAFYVAVHIVNAHLAKCQNLHYRNHDDVKNAISPTNVLSVCKVDEPVYIAFEKLHNCSRRARYLISDDMTNRSEGAHNVSDKYLAKSIRCLDIIIGYFVYTHSIEKLTPIEIKCERLKNDTFKFFKIL